MGIWQYPAGTEEDAGVQYPTLIQDTNGNQITISYAAGQSVTSTNSSRRVRTLSVVAPDGASTTTYVYAANTVALSARRPRWRQRHHLLVTTTGPAGNPEPARWPNVRTASPMAT